MNKEEFTSGMVHAYSDVISAFSKPDSSVVRSF